MSSSAAASACCDAATRGASIGRGLSAETSDEDCKSREKNEIKLKKGSKELRENLRDKKERRSMQSVAHRGGRKMLPGYTPLAESS